MHVYFSFFFSFSFCNLQARITREEKQGQMSFPSDRYDDEAEDQQMSVEKKKKRKKILRLHAHRFSDLLAAEEDSFFFPFVRSS
jgi:hypothetical protein